MGAFYFYNQIIIAVQQIKRIIFTCLPPPQARETGEKSTVYLIIAISLFITERNDML